MVEELNKQQVEDLVIGGSILGGGGGGSIEEGLKIGDLAINSGLPKIIKVDDLEKEDIVITVSAVGAPAAENQFLLPIDFVETISLLNSKKDTNIKGIITNENGGLATINGLFQSSITGIPVIDASCNGRAHPTGIMGAMGLNNIPGYQTVQAAVGGKPGTIFRLKQLLEGDISTTSSLVRQMSVLAGGLVAVARNPVSLEYLENNGAIDSISHALKIGQAHHQGKTPEEKIENVINVLEGQCVVIGKVTSLDFQTIDGFDIGKVNIKGGNNNYELTIWNEYITLENDEEKRIGTFPDLIMTFDTETGMPITSAELRDGLEITVIHTDKKNLILGKGMKIKENYKIVEEKINKKLINFIEDLF